MNRVSFKGIVLAALVVLVLDTIAGLGMAVFMGDSSLLEGNDQQTKDAIEALTLSTNFLLGSVIFGTLATIVGGYVAGRIGKTAPYLNAGIIGVLGIVFGLLLNKDYPLWFNVAGFVSVLPAALLGGHLARSRVAGEIGEA